MRSVVRSARLVRSAAAIRAAPLGRRRMLSTLPHTPLGTNTDQLADRVASRDHELRKGAELDEAAYRKKLIYRSKQRGWLEVDLLMGSWATQHVPSLTSDELRQYEAIIECETLDIYNLVVGRLELSEELSYANPVLEKIRKYAESNPLGRASPARYDEVKGMMSN